MNAQTDGTKIAIGVDPQFAAFNLQPFSPLVAKQLQELKQELVAKLRRPNNMTTRGTRSRRWS